ncbi:MAG: VOC family protein [Verrucomicrobiota bacterium]
MPKEPSFTVSLTVKDAGAALDFYVRALGAVELFRMPDPSGNVLHAEFLIGEQKLYISGEDPEWHAHAFPEGMAAPCLFAVLTENCDVAFQKAVDAGMTPLAEPSDQFWGVRTSIVKDPFGYRWNLRTVIEEVSPEELMRRAQKFMEG